jgi:hypothetical protein
MSSAKQKFPLSSELQGQVRSCCRDGREIRVTREQLVELGQVKKPLVTAIREMCVSCMGGSTKEVALCTSVCCPLWVFRFGINPWDPRSSLLETRILVKQSGDEEAA